MINFNVPPYTGKEIEYIKQAVENQKICGDGPFTKKCNEWIEKKTGTTKCLLTPSCTQATELAALLADIKEGDEIIMPSFTFVSTADAFVLRGAKPIFVDIRPDTMNIDETKIEEAITERTKAIVPVHYAGVACEMDTIMDIAARHHLMVIEDAAQGIMASYKGQALGAIGDFGCFSFHETKNVSMGEGGAILIKDAKYIEDAEIIDNSFIMLLKVMIRLGVKKVALGGFDGYMGDRRKNYVNPNMEYKFSKKQAESLNEYVCTVLKTLSDELEMEFITDSLYAE